MDGEMEKWSDGEMKARLLTPALSSNEEEREVGNAVMGRMRFEL